MNPSNARALPNSARIWPAIGFAVVAITVLVSQARALARNDEVPASAAAIAAPMQLVERADQVDWSRLPMANITPAESVAAYDR